MKGGGASNSTTSPEQFIITSITGRRNDNTGPLSVPARYQYHFYSSVRGVKAGIDAYFRMVLPLHLAASRRRNAGVEQMQASPWRPYE